MEKTFKLLVVFFVFVVFMFNCASSIKWLSLQHSRIQWNVSTMNNNPGRGIRSSMKSPCSIARKKYGLVKVQAKLCRNSMDAMPHVQIAATLAVETCKNIFGYHKWNCSSVDMAPTLTPDLTRATKEQAYVYAISSAALTFTIARACSSGSLQHCTCAGKPEIPPNGQFQWGGCGDNVRWGAQFAKRFLDNVEKHIPESKAIVEKVNGIGTQNVLQPPTLGYIEESGPGRHEVALINLHNNRVGRKVVLDSLRTQCKCHGVSGSCNIKTCWKALPSMAEIGQLLLEKYYKAVQVPKYVMTTLVPEEVLRKERNKLTSTQLLVYLSQSPDYCVQNETLGSMGTTGRQCFLSSPFPEASCKDLCCRRGHRIVVEEKIERCKCKFYNCCYVKCKICRTTKRTYECY